MTISEELANEYYRALVNKDPNYMGVFFACVTSTSIFCISTCRARKPLRKNVIFYKTTVEAVENGFRACKVCRP